MSLFICVYALFFIDGAPHPAFVFLCTKFSNNIWAAIRFTVGHILLWLLKHIEHQISLSSSLDLSFDMGTLTKLP